MSYCYKYPRPALTVDALVVSNDGKVLLIKRKNPPFEGMWALPGGFMDMDETPEEAVARELLEETGLAGMDFRQFHTYGALQRDPRHRTVSIVFIAETGFSEDIKVHGGDDASEAGWVSLNKLPEMAFDHAEIIKDFVNQVF